MNLQGDQGQPFFSVIVPTYNRAHHLRKALDSIKAQEYKDYEVIIVDDGSTDGTREIAEEYAQDNRRFKYCYKINEERSIARNYGIKHASGKYIGFLDSDDFFYPNHLMVARELLKQREFPEVAHLGYEIVNDKGIVVEVKNNFDSSVKEMLIHENVLNVNAIFIRQDIIREINFIPSPSAVISEDWYVWLRLASRYQFHFEGKITSAIHQHGERSLMNIDPDKLVASTNLIVEGLKNDTSFLTAYKGKVSYHFANHYTLLTLVLALTKIRRWETIKYSIRAIGYDPTVIFRRRFLASLKHLF